MGCDLPQGWFQLNGKVLWRLLVASTMADRWWRGLWLFSLSKILFLLSLVSAIFICFLLSFLLLLLFYTIWNSLVQNELVWCQKPTFSFYLQFNFFFNVFSFFCFSPHFPQPFGQVGLSLNLLLYYLS